VGIAALDRTFTPTATVSAPATGDVSWFRIAVAMWLLGIVILFVWMLYGRLFMRRIARGIEPERSGRLYESLNQAASELSIRRPVTLLVGGPLFVPVTWGLLYPVVMLPADARTWPAEQVRVTLVHELAHIRRNDPLFHLIAWAAAALMWFNPLGWIALRRMRASAERAADDSVLRAGVRPSAYVDTLVNMVKRAGSDSFAGSAAFAMARRSEFERRMLAVLDEKTSRKALSGAPALAGAAAFLAIAVLLSVIPAEAARVMPVAAVASASEAEVWIKAAGQAPGDPDRIDPLTKAVATGEMNAPQISRYLDVVGTMNDGIAKAEVIRVLAGGMRLSDEQLGRLLELTRSIGKQIPTVTALTEIAKTQNLGASDRSAYLEIASRLDGIPMRAALDALK
jgi:beta-lactamase regulating signal transducer with metallopeptidase domain